MLAVLQILLEKLLQFLHFSFIRTPGSFLLKILKQTKNNPSSAEEKNFKLSI